MFVGLTIMFLAGWIHRDVSAGNILWDAVAGGGLIADLEYAKKTTDETASLDPKTVSPFS